jgi:hypothetical protein
LFKYAACIYRRGLETSISVPTTDTVCLYYYTVSILIKLESAVLIPTIKKNLCSLTSTLQLAQTALHQLVDILGIQWIVGTAYNTYNSSPRFGW